MMENEFRDWMDDRRLKPSDICTALQVSEQRVRQWRSDGVPPRRLPHVKKFMKEWQDPATMSPVDALRQQTIVVHATREEFRAWESAARKAGEDHIEDWARLALDAYAKEEDGGSDSRNAGAVVPFKPTSPQLAMVAEEKPEFKANTKPADGKTSVGTSAPKEIRKSQNKQA